MVSATLTLKLTLCSLCKKRSYDGGKYRGQIQGGCSGAVAPLPSLYSAHAVRSPLPRTLVSSLFCAPL